MADRKDVLLFILICLAVASCGFGAWMGSFGAGLWMFAVFMWAEGLSENLKR